MTDPPADFTGVVYRLEQAEKWIEDLRHRDHEKANQLTVIGAQTTLLRNFMLGDREADPNDRGRVGELSVSIARLSVIVEELPAKMAIQIKSSRTQSEAANWTGLRRWIVWTVGGGVAVVVFAAMLLSYLHTVNPHLP